VSGLRQDGRSRKQAGRLARPLFLRPAVRARLHHAARDEQQERTAEDARPVPRKLRSHTRNIAAAHARGAVAVLGLGPCPSAWPGPGARSAEQATSFEPTSLERQLEEVLREPVAWRLSPQCEANRWSRA